MIFIVDTRNQQDKFVVKGLQALGHTVIRSKLPFGDIALSTDILKCIDFKSSGGGLIELARNICSSDHSRLRIEIEKCLAVNGKITFLCFEPNITCVSDIAKWQVPRFKNDIWKTVYIGPNKKAFKKSELLINTEYEIKHIIAHRKGDLMTQVKPETLMKAITTMSTPNHYKYGVTINFEFATKENCAEKILELLKGNAYEK